MRMLPDVKQKGYKKESENNAENRTWLHAAIKADDMKKFKKKM